MEEKKKKNLPLSLRPVVHRPKCIPSPPPVVVSQATAEDHIAERRKVLLREDVIGCDLHQMAEEIYWSRASAQDGTAILSLHSRQEKAAGSAANLNFQTVYAFSRRVPAMCRIDHG